MTFIRYAGPAVHAAVPCSLLSMPGTHEPVGAAVLVADVVALLVADTAGGFAAPDVVVQPCIVAVQLVVVAETGAGATVQC